MSTAEAPKEAPRDPAKSAPPPPVTVKKAKPSSDDDAEGAPAGAAPPKPRMLSTGLSRAIVLATVLASLILAAVNLFTNRYDVVALPSSPNGAVYRVDRLTGNIMYCGTTACTDVAIRAAAK